MAEEIVTETARQAAVWAAVAAEAAERIKATTKAAGAVARVAAAVAREAELAPVVAAVLDQMVALGARTAYVHMATEERRELRLVDQRNLPTDHLDRLASLSFDAPCLAARAASTRQIQVVEDAGNLDPGLALDRAVLTGTGSRSVLSAPLIASGRLVGILTYALPDPHRFSSEELAAIRTIVEVFAVGLTNALVFEEERRLRTKLQAIVDSAPDALICIEAATDRVMANPKATELFGHPLVPEAGRAQVLGQLYRPDGRPLTLPEMLSSRALRGESITGEELLIVRPDGRRIPVLASAAPLRGPGGNVTSAVIIFQDISERKRIEQERERLLDQLEAERSWLRTVIERSPVGIILVKGPRGERTTANRWAKQLFGHAVPDEATIAQYVGRVFRPDGTPLTYEEMLPVRALRGECVTGCELAIRRPDGRDVPVLVNTGPIRDATGSTIGAVVVLEDITPIKQLERLREEWTAIIAHDLRQPITLISGYASLLAKLARQRAADPREQARLDQIIASAHQLNRMIADLLDVSRIETRRLKLERQTTELPALVRAVVERLAEVTASHPVRLDVKGEIPRLEVDPGRLEQVLTNLLSNAAKYGYPGTEIWVAVERRAGEVAVSVANQGKGIAPEDLPELFTRFHRTSWAREERIAGLGLGLYIARGIVEAHGGRIWAESVPGQTTTFRFTLPVATGC